MATYDIEFVARDNTGRSFRSVGRGLGNVRNLALGAAGAVAGVTTAVAAATSEYLESARATRIMSQEAGIAVRDFSRLSEAANTIGVEQDTLRDIVFDTRLALSEATAEAGAQREALEQLGLQYERLNTLSPEEQLYAVVDALNAAEGSTTAMASAATLLGEGTLRDLNPLIAEGSAGLRQLADAAEDAGVVLDEEAAAAAQMLDRQMTVLNQTLEGARNRLVQGLVPVLSNVADVVLPAVEGALETTEDWLNRAANAGNLFAAALRNIGANATAADAALVNAFNTGLSDEARAQLTATGIDAFTGQRVAPPTRYDYDQRLDAPVAESVGLPAWTQAIARNATATETLIRLLEYGRYAGGTHGAVGVGGQYSASPLFGHTSNVGAPPAPLGTAYYDFLALNAPPYQQSSYEANVQRTQALGLTNANVIETEDKEVADKLESFRGSSGGIKIDGESLIELSKSDPLRVFIAGFGGTDDNNVTRFQQSSDSLINIDNLNELIAANLARGAI